LVWNSLPLPIRSPQSFNRFKSRPRNSSVCSSLSCVYCRSAVCIYCSLCSVLCFHTADGPRDALCQSKSCQCDTPVGTGCTTNPQQIGVAELERYGRRTCSKPRASCHDAVHRRKCGQQARQSISFVNCPHDRMPWGNINQSINQSINVKFVGRRYTRRPGAPTVVSGTHDQKVHS